MIRSNRPGPRRPSGTTRGASGATPPTTPRGPVSTGAEQRRIEQARVELGATRVSRRLARWLVAGFLGTLVLPHVAQVATDPGHYRDVARLAAIPAPTGPGSRTARLRAANRALLGAIQVTEETIADTSVLGTQVRPFVQRVLTTVFGTGNARVEPASGGWLFYRPDLDHVTGLPFLSPRHAARRHDAARTDTLATDVHPDPRPALLALHAFGVERGITVVVLPAPVKPSADPQRLSGAVAAGTVVSNPSYRPFLDELRRAGVAVFDPTDILGDRMGGPRYLATDTHWRPATMTRVAAALARFLERTVDLSPAPPALQFRVTPTEVRHQGDTAALLGLSSGTRFPPETVTAGRVTTAGGDAWTPDATAEVLLLGDSFTNVFSQAAIGWGTAAGLAEHLSVALNRPVDRLSQNDDGALAPRRLLATVLARTPGRLTRTRTIVYQFAARELSQGDWRPVDYASPPRAPRPAPWEPADGAVAVVEATVAAMGRVPRPGSVPYRDHIAAMHLIELSIRSGLRPDGATDAVVYVRTMADNELTALASLQPGARVRLRLQPWANVADDLDGITRAELDDLALLRATPWWGEPVEE